jgi:hypothetical protein
MRFEVSQKWRGGAAHVGSRLTVAKVKTADPANTRTTETSGSRSARKVPDPGIFGSPLLAGRGKWGSAPIPWWAWRRREKATELRRLLLDGINPLRRETPSGRAARPLPSPMRRNSTSPDMRGPGNRRIMRGNGTIRWTVTFCRRSENGRSEP